MTETERVAAEFVLGLLSGEELLAARARLSREPGFAEAVAVWEDRFAPLLDEIGGASPASDLWPRIAAAIDAGSDGAEVVALRRRLNFWRWTGAASSAVAAMLLAFVALRPGAAPVPVTVPAPEAPLIASIPIAETQLRIAVTYLPGQSELLVSASGLQADGVHDHELWLVPTQGPLRSLGVIRPGTERRLRLDAAVAREIADGSRMVLTREPLGGKPANAAAGPVVAEGAFQAV